MKQVSLVSIGLVALSLASPALAADLSPRVYGKAPGIMASPYYDWSGFYIGANAGYGWAQDGHADIQGGFFSNGPLDVNGGNQRIKSSGAVYGGQAGYNWQYSSWVLGAEVAGDGSSLRRTDGSIFIPGTEFLSSKINGLLTITGRVGYAFNNWLPYIKGGYAGAKFSTSNFDIVGDTLNHSQWRSGYTVGGGIEYGITSNWTVGVEYSYMDFGSVMWAGFSTGPGPGTGLEVFSDKLQISTVTGRINYKFGGPVVSKY